VKYRPLGKTGITVSEIGFGTWGLGGNAYGPIDDGVSIQALQTAFDQGITFFDTSDLYGDGRSENVLGQALHEVRESVVICTKIGLLPHTGFSMPHDFSPQYIRQGIEGSLRRLKTDYVDLYLLHSPTIDILEKHPEALGVMAELQEAGLIRSYGVSVRSPADGIMAIQQFNIAAIEVNFNLIDQRAIENGLLEHAQKIQAGIIVRTPLCFGYLTGHLRGDEQFEGIDHRANWPTDQLQRWAEAPEYFSSLAESRKTTISQLALRFCLDQESVSTVIPGMMNSGQVLENVVSSQLESLTTEEKTRIHNIYQANSFYDKKAKQESLTA
jgi:aryl-alcohol dehydrogenase-like predicted oxidoreductase